MLYKKLVKPYMFRKDPEKAHHLMIDLLKKMGNQAAGRGVLKQLYGSESHSGLEQSLWDIHFPNPVGLAAGLDKNGEAIPAFSSIGFGSVEIGTITPRPQSGNELPRLFRLVSDEAIINRMGFNNRGAEDAAQRLQKLTYHPVPVGINIGKNKETPNEQAVEDYQACIKLLYPYGDYFVINISSPNTPGLRNLQHGEDLKQLINGVLKEIEAQAEEKGLGHKPVLVKLAPDLSVEELEAMLDSIQNTQISGIIATNTTLSREGLQDAHQGEMGGLSGRPLTKRSTEVIKSIYQATKGQTPIIGVGGIFNGQDAYDKICAGASLVQVYTGLIYEGPEVVKNINKQLVQLMQADGYTHIQEAIGTKAIL